MDHAVISGDFHIVCIGYRNSVLNDKTDDFLELHDFSREEIKSGIENAADGLGVSGIAKMFLEDR